MENEQAKKQPKRKRKFWKRILKSTVIAAIISVAGVCIANFYTKTLAEMATYQKYTEFAVGILRDSSDKIGPLKDWAMDIIDECGPVKLSPEARKALKENPLNIYRCPDGTYPDRNGNCVSNSYTSCPDGYMWDSNQLKCIPSKRY